MQIKRKINAIIRNEKLKDLDSTTTSQREKANETIDRLERELTEDREKKGFDGTPEGVAQYLKSEKVEISWDYHWRMGNGDWC